MKPWINFELEEVRTGFGIGIYVCLAVNGSFDALVLRLVELR